MISLAIEFRLEALARLDKSGGLRGWSIPGANPGQKSIHPDLVKAAAEEPLTEDANKRAAFDPESFRRRVLANIETEGRG